VLLSLLEANVTNDYELITTVTCWCTSTRLVMIIYAKNIDVLIAVSIAERIVRSVFYS
jgi:uncharacterized LabA/DUF88 family protein